MPAPIQSVSHSRWTALALLCMALVGASRFTPAATADAIDTAARQLDSRISGLIRQLGNKHYSVRQRAEVELSRLGLVAFDALFDAQEDDEVEVALRARFRYVACESIGFARTILPRSKRCYVAMKE